MSSFKARVGTPEGVILETEFVSASLPTPTGRVTILANHQSYLTRIDQGLITLKSVTEEDNLLVLGGFARFINNQLTLVCDLVLKESEDVERQIKEALEVGTNRRQEVLSHQQQIYLESQLRRGLETLNLKGKLKTHRSHHSPPLDQG